MLTARNQVQIGNQAVVLWMRYFGKRGQYVIVWVGLARFHTCNFCNLHWDLDTFGWKWKKFSNTGDVYEGILRSA